MATTGMCRRLPRDLKRRSTIVADIVLRQVGRAADVDRLVDDLRPRQDLDRELRHILDRDVVGDGAAVTEDRRHALLANPLADDLVDPDVHERGRPQHHPRDAAPADGVLDVPLDAEDIDRRILRDAAIRDVDQPAHAGVARRGAEVLVGAEIGAGRAVRALAHVVVGGGDDLLDIATGLGELRQVAHVHRGDLGARRQRAERRRRCAPAPAP